MTTQGLEPRRAALGLLDAVIGEHRLLNELLPRRLSQLAPADRARALRLTNSCLRFAHNADRLLGPHLRQLPPLTTMNILRLGVVAICQEREPAHGVVNACVELAGAAPETRRTKGLVNAILRRIARDGPAKWSELPAPALPGWLRKPLVAAWGGKAVRAIEAAHALGGATDLTVRDDAAGWAARLGGTVLPTGSVRLHEAAQLSALPGYSEGAWWVQDAAAALPARALAPAPGERVLDLCAAPGGKTMQLAAAGADVTAVDISPRRLERLRDNLDRTGLSARLVAQDALKFMADPFDAVLLDAPCSATGTIRRHPDLPHAKDAGVLRELVPLQQALIDHALALLRPGGRLVYCTCSLLPAEGAGQIAAATERHRGLAVDRAALALPGVAPEWIDEAGLVTRPDYWPERGGMDGFFITVLRPAPR